MSAQTKRINRHDVLDYIKELVSKSGDNEIALSVTDLAKEFNVTQPTMDYHIKNLVKDGLLAPTNKVGRYNRKVYRVPTQTKVVTPITDKDLLEKLMKMKQEVLQTDQDEVKTEVVVPSHSESQETHQAVGRIEHPEEPENKQETEIIMPKDQQPEPDPVPEIELKPVEPQESQPDAVITKDNQAYILEVKHMEEEMEQREKSLDEKIDDFLMRSKAIPNPQDILKKDDREILAVMNETIHQNMAYLRNLEDQLSTVENKQMILQLVEDRERILKELDEQNETAKNLMQENQMLRTKEKQQEEAIDPGRIRFMQQRILATLDNHVEQPNHAMAIGKHEFRKNMTKELNDLIRYVLGLEK